MGPQEPKLPNIDPQNKKKIKNNYPQRAATCTSDESDSPLSLRSKILGFWNPSPECPAVRMRSIEVGFDIRILDSGFGYRGSDLGYRGSGLGYRGSGLGYRGSGLGYRGSGLGYRGSGLGYRGSGLGYRGSGLGYRGSGLDYRGSGL